MQGIVLNIDLKSDTGLVRAADGKRYGFKLSDCETGSPLNGNTVDFEIDDDNRAVKMHVVGTSVKSALDGLYWLMFSTRGRISREQFIAFFAVALLLLPFPAIAMAWAGLPLLYFVLMWAGSAYVCFAVTVKRFHDSGSSAFWLVSTALIGAVAASAMFKVVAFPFLSDAVISLLCTVFGLFVLFCLYLSFAKGTMGENRYGKEPASCKTIRLK